MLKRFILISLLVLGTAAVAYAGNIYGYGWTCCSTFSGTVFLKGAPNFDSRPTVLIANMTLDLEAYCNNPAGGSFSQQQIHFITQTTAGVPLANGQPVGNGKTEVDVDVNLDLLVGDGACTQGSGDWTLVPNSIGVTAATITQTWYYCTGDPNNPDDGDPCFNYDANGQIVEITADLKKVIDSVTVNCTIDELLRNPDLSVVHDQTFTCPKV